MDEHIIIPEQPYLEGFDVWSKLNSLVDSHWDKLYSGASRIIKDLLPYEIKNIVAIEEDAFAPQRIEIHHQMSDIYSKIGETRFHFVQGIKYFAGTKYDDPVPPDELQVRSVVHAIQTILDSYATDQKFSFKVLIKD
jgi:hypothetical protein